MYQYMEDGYESKKVTGVVFVNLSAAYNTVNDNLLLKKTYEYTNDWYKVLPSLQYGVKHKKNKNWRYFSIEPVR